MIHDSTSKQKSPVYRKPVLKSDRCAPDTSSQLLNTTTRKIWKPREKKGECQHRSKNMPNILAVIMKKQTDLLAELISNISLATQYLKLLKLTFTVEDIFDLINSNYDKSEQLLKVSKHGRPEGSCNKFKYYNSIFDKPVAK